MIKLFSHHLKTISSLVTASIGEHGSFDKVIEVLASEDDKVFNTTEDVLKELIELSRNETGYEDPEKYLNRIFVDSYMSTLYRYAASDVYEALLISYLNTFTLSRATGRQIKGNKDFAKIIENSLLYLENTTYHNEEMFFEIFSNVYDTLVESIYDNNLPETALDFVEDDKAWHHYRVLSLSCMRVMLAACRLESNADIEFGGRAGLYKMMVKQLNGLNETIISLFNNIDTVVGIVEYDINSNVQSLVFIESGDLNEAGVVVFDKETPLTDVFFNELAEEHNSYSTLQLCRTSYIVADGVVVPFLTDEIRSECSSLTLHEVTV